MSPRHVVEEVNAGSHDGESFSLPGLVAKVIRGLDYQHQSPVGCVSQVILDFQQSAVMKILEFWKHFDPLPISHSRRGVLLLDQGAPSARQCEYGFFLSNLVYLFRRRQSEPPL